MRKRLTTKEFIKKAREVHGSRYDYFKVEYVKSIEKVIIVCRYHDEEFNQTPHSHLRGRGCPCCGEERRIQLQTKSTQKFVEESKNKHKDKYDYSKTKYVNDNTKVIIICPEHGEFEQKPYSHLGGSGCSVCGGKEKKDTFKFVKDAINKHGDKYDYSEVEYEGGKIKITIICPEHGEFRQAPSKHLYGDGCPFCVKKNEGKVKNLLFKYFKDWDIIPQKKIWDNYKDCSSKRKCDFWLEKEWLKIIVEYDGEGHFMPVCFCGMSLQKAKKKFAKQQKIDKLDAEFCKENNIILHRIKYNEDKENSVVRFKEKINKMGCRDAT